MVRSCRLINTNYENKIPQKVRKMKPKGKLSRGRLRTTGEEGYHKREKRKSGKVAVDEEVWLLNDSHKIEKSKEKEHCMCGCLCYVYGCV